jgi:hypothetical protein
MRKTLAAGTVALLAFFVASSYAFAGSFSFSWKEDQKSESHQTIAKAPKKKGQPDHAPAHGYRSKHQYRYYPSASVYHDAERGLYFYLSGSGWQIAASIPNDLKARLGGSVSIELDTDKPYIYNDRHREQYPPEKATKKKHKKGKK